MCTYSYICICVCVYVYQSTKLRCRDSCPYSRAPQVVKNHINDTQSVECVVLSSYEKTLIKENAQIQMHRIS